MKRKNKISGQFSARLIEMLESPAFRVLTLAERRVLDRAEIELSSHGGNDNGSLPITYGDLVSFGIKRDSIPPSLRALDALGLLKCTKRGRGGNAEHREPSAYFITYAHARNSNHQPPTHEWRRIKTIEEARKRAPLRRRLARTRAMPR